MDPAQAERGNGVRAGVSLLRPIGRPVVNEIKVQFEATMYDAPGAPGMAGPRR
jgi:hypothetical protein